MTRNVDAVVIGSGQNGLVAAAYLAIAGWDVEVLERNPTAGGAIGTEELTEPGFLHDTFSSWHTLFHLSAAFAELGPALAARGLEYLNSDAAVTATARRDGQAVLAHRDPAQSAAAFGEADMAAYFASLERFGANIDVVGELLGTELFSRRALRLGTRLYRRLGRRDALAFAGALSSSARDWLSTFSGRAVGDLLAPWALHTGLTPDDAGGGFQLPAIAATLHQIGLPIVAGGSANFVAAFTRLIEDHGGRVRTGVEVEGVLTRGGRASGVIAGGEEIATRRAVIANATPTQLYGELLPEGAAPSRAVAQARDFRYSRRAGMQIHLALSEPPRWADGRLDAVPLVHLSDGLEAVSLACAQARAGLLPAEPTIACGQQTILDPSRAPAGRATLWIQLQEVPYAPSGDSAGEIDVGDGTWTAELEAAYAERILDRIAAQIPNLRGSILGRAILSPLELERRNRNLVRGDIYAGATDASQSFFWRPLPSYGSHATPIDRLYMCGASTYPGPGLNAASGRIVAGHLLGRRLRRRSPLS